MSVLFFLLGFLSTMQIFKYKIWEVYIYPFDLLYYILIIILASILIKNKKTERKTIAENGKIILVIFLFYYLFSINLFIPIFENTFSDYLLVTVKFFIKKSIFILFFFLVFYSKSKIRETFIKHFILGFFISILFHSLYSYCTSYFWYFHHYDIHTIWLNLIGITAQSVGHDLINFIFVPILRTTGFHWDPAYFGLWGVIGMFYIQLQPYNFSTKFLLNLIIFVPWIFTFSRSAIFGMIVVIAILKIIMIITNKPIKHLFNTQNYKIVLIIALLLLSFIAIMSFSGSLSSKNILESRLQVTEDEHTKKHIQYPYIAVKAIMQNSYHFIFGYGNRNSGRVVEEYITTIESDFSINETYDIESDISRIVINTGILGFSFYLIFIFIILYNLLMRYIKTYDILMLFVFLTICTTFFAGFFYAYNDSIWVWMFYIIAVIMLQRSEDRKALSHKKNE